MKITIYTTKQCGGCHKVVEKLNDNFINHKVVDDEAKVLEIARERKMRTVPIMKVEENKGTVWLEGRARCEQWLDEFTERSENI